MVFLTTPKQTLNESFDYNGKLLFFDASGFISPQNKLGGATVRAQRQTEGPLGYYSIGNYTAIAQAAARGNSDIWEITAGSGIIKPATGAVYITL